MSDENEIQMLFTRTLFDALLLLLGFRSDLLLGSGAFLRSLVLTGGRTAVLSINALPVRRRLSIVVGFRERRFFVDDLLQ